MLHKLRARAQDEKGFTLIELLVVILIIGILAAIALPAFLNQRAKAQDSEAKSGARTAQTAMETFYTDNQTYVGSDAALGAGGIRDIEPALANANGLAFNPAPTATGYTVSVTSKSNDATVYSITNNAGTVTRSCDDPGKGGCKAAGGGAGTW
jgi:type IV pilus assembly protein PilA